MSRIFAIYDSKAEAYLQPFFAKTKSDAIRSITSLVNDPAHNFHKWATDFTLFELAMFDEDKGVIVPLEAKLPLGNFLEFKREEAM